jgi:TolB-like protein/DNA-binding winged helix-turn-helix (wHTH) protein/Tfp pilus assembly protein PilF
MSSTPNRLYQFGEFTVDVDQRVLLRNGTPISLPPKLFDTFIILVHNKGRIVGKEELMNQLWPDTFVEEANLAVNIQQLRKVLGDNARKPLFIETVARRGYRFIAHVEEGVSESGLWHIEDGGLENHLPPSNNEAEVEPLDNETKTREFATAITTPSNLSLRSGTKWIPRLLLIMAVALLTSSGIWFLLARMRVHRQPTGRRSMVAVLPFKNLTGDDTQDYFSDGLTEEVITQLGNLDPQHLGVIAPTSVMHYKNSQTSLEQVSHELGVQYVLEGSVRRDATKVRVAAQLVETKGQTQIWAQAYDRELSDVLALQAEIAQQVANEIDQTLGGQKQVPTNSLNSSPQVYEAYELYLRGQYFFNKRSNEGFEQAIHYFQQAIEKDPKYARAYAGLADSYALIGGYSGRPQTEFLPKARAAALRALEIDESLPEAHTAFALIVQNYDWDWQTSEKEFRRSIELNPNYATAHHWYAEHLMWLGRFDEALRESEIARELDPLSLIVSADRGAILYYSRQYDRAITQFRSVREMDPNFPRTALIERAYERNGQLSEALTDVRKLQLSYHGQPWAWAELAHFYGKSGQRPQARHAIEKLLEMDQNQQLDPATLMWAYLGMGDTQQTFAYLEKAYAEHSNTLVSLKVEPCFDPLRGDPRFQELLRRVGLAQ